MKQRTAEQWGAIYDVLINEARAPSSERESFIYHCCYNLLTEWRFQGSLGFGGKVWQRDDGTVKVTCYQEDETTDRRDTIQRVNQLLSEL